MTASTQAAAAHAAVPADSVRSTWKSLALIRVQRLRTDLDIALSSSASPGGDVPRQIGNLLDRAERLATAPGRWRGLVTWLTGADITRTWALLHEADELLYLVEDDDTIRAKAPELLAAVRSRIEATDPRRDVYEGALRGTTEKLDRPLLRQIRKNLYEIEDDAHGRVRNFRNVALGATVILSGAMIFVAFDPPSKPWLPLAHGTGPWPTVWQIELVGALGGLLAGITALRSLEGFAGPYALPTVMAALKIPAGALTGLMGALWMQNGVLGVLSPQDGLKILAYVGLFGFAQQAFTTFADRQAGQLLGEAKGKQPATGSGAGP